MADRSFLNNDLLLQRGAYLNMPLFTSIFNYGKCRYLTSNEVNEKKNIAWMHVEQAIQGLKSFQFLSGTMYFNPISGANSKSSAIFVIS